MLHKIERKALNIPGDARGAHPAVALASIAILRSAFFCFFVFCIDRVIDLGTSPWLVSGGAVAGLAAASYLAFTRLTQRGFFTLAAALLALSWLLFAVLERIPAGPRIFGFYALEQHSDLVLLAFCAAAVSTWLFWKFKHALTAEIILLAAVFISLLAAHRNYHFDTLSFVSGLAWRYGLSQLAMLVLLGALLFALLLAYFLVATLPGKPAASAKETQVLLHDAAGNRLAGSLILAGGLLLLWLISYHTYRFHYTVSLSMIRNGVGEENREGMSPLDFRSALGTSNQPAALVRLEGDYQDNPFTPLMYLRESALSAFDPESKTMVVGRHDLDSDVPFTTPEQPYDRPGGQDLPYRVPVTQSIYLLTKHKGAFGLDYPVSIRQLQLPDKTDKFKAAYRVYSMAPAFQLPEILQTPVGDPSWAPEIWRYYLRTHPDRRYKEKAEELTAGADLPVAKAAKLIEWLNRNAIYTLTPNHEEKDGEDPVAPFLFGDRRGYCVHFAHAIVYMLRSLDIPARIGTGYLTDLSQSKDGHILLRMSDRHAWAEAYIEGRGWVPFDVQPDQVESHAETTVDMNVLEELMGLLEPGEEILPQETIKGEKGFREEAGYYTPRARDLLFAVGVILGMLGACKALLLFGWLLPASPQRRLRRGYAAMLARLHDMGARRRFGETREEFRRRVSAELGFSILRATDVLNALNYAADGGATLTAGTVRTLMRDEQRALRQAPLRKRIRAALNPSSVLSGLGGWKW